MARKGNQKKMKERPPEKKEIKKERTPVRLSERNNIYVIAGIAVVVLLVGVAIGYVLSTGVSTEKAEKQSIVTARAILLVDENCNYCMDTFSRVVDILKANFDLNSMPIEEVSVYSEEGKRIYSALLENNINVVPLVVLEGNIEETEFYKTLDKRLAMYGGAKRVLFQAGEYYVLLPDWPTRRYDPNAPIQNVEVYAPEKIRTVIVPVIYQAVENAEVKTADPEGDYVMMVVGPENLLQNLARAIPTAKIENGTLIVPKKDRVTVDLYVMSFCPFGNQAEDIAKKIKEKFGDLVVIEPHFIISDLGDNNFRSLHGDQELHQDVREVCVRNIYGPENWLEFATKINTTCNSNNADSCWQNVAKEMNLDVDAIEECYSKEFNSIASAEAAKATAMGVTGSPTTFIDGWFRYDIRNPDFTEVLCYFLKNPPANACSMEIQTSAPSGSCG